MLLCTIWLTLWSLSCLAETSIALSHSEPRVLRLGRFTPYHTVPTPPGITSKLPDDCTVHQVIMMGRHGSRYPSTTDIKPIRSLVRKLQSHTEVIKNTSLSENLEFLRGGYTSDLGVSSLTTVGRQELFDHGAQFRLDYPHIPITHILAGNYDRVVESADWFALGYFGRSWANFRPTYLSTIEEDDVTPSTITPELTCPAWATHAERSPTQEEEWGQVYLPPITERLNDMIPGVGFEDEDIHGALFSCAYDLAAHGPGYSPWCDVFTDDELADFEYEPDLMMEDRYGHNLPDDMGSVLGSLYVSSLIERLTNSTGNASSVYVEFAHDSSLSTALTGLGLAKDDPPLKPERPLRPNRKFLTTKLTPFASQMKFEKFSCTSSFPSSEHQVRLIINGGTLPLDYCAMSEVDSQYGTCDLKAFTKVNELAAGVRWGDETWKRVCDARDSRGTLRYQDPYDDALIDV